jgi:hypothetical protein
MTNVSGKNVRQMFNQEEKAILELKFGPIFSTTSISAGPHFFTSSNGNYVVGETFDVVVKVDSMSEVISGVDVVGTYDSSVLELVSIQGGPNMVFNNNGQCTIKNQSAGNFVFHCFSNQTSSDLVIKGNLATLTFKAKTKGSAKIQFICQNGSTTDSNIAQTQTSLDLIDCSKNENALFIISKSELFCDLNFDGVVNSIDFSILKSNINKTMTSQTKGDLNNDKVINSIDITIMKASLWKR